MTIHSTEHRPATPGGMDRLTIPVRYLADDGSPIAQRTEPGPLGNGPMQEEAASHAPAPPDADANAAGRPRWADLIDDTAGRPAPERGSHRGPAWRERAKGVGKSVLGKLGDKVRQLELDRLPEDMQALYWRHLAASRKHDAFLPPPPPQMPRLSEAATAVAERVRTVRMGDLLGRLVQAPAAFMDSQREWRRQRQQEKAAQADRLRQVIEAGGTPVDRRGRPLAPPRPAPEATDISSAPRQDAKPKKSTREIVEAPFIATSSFAGMVAYGTKRRLEAMAQSESWTKKRLAAAAGLGVFAVAGAAAIYYRDANVMDNVMDTMRQFVGFDPGTTPAPDASHVPTPGDVMPTASPSPAEGFGVPDTTPSAMPDVSPSASADTGPFNDLTIADGTPQPDTGTGTGSGIDAEGSILSTEPSTPPNKPETVVLGEYNARTGEGTIWGLAKENIGLGDISDKKLTSEQMKQLIAEKNRILELNFPDMSLKDAEEAAENLSSKQKIRI